MSAKGINRVTLLGRLGCDPEMRTTTSGQQVVTLNLATSERWRDRASGESKERTEWHKVVIFDERLATIAATYLVKGSQVYVEGQLQTRKWQDQSGADRYSTEVVLSQYRGQLVLLGNGAGGGKGSYADRRKSEAGGMPLDADIPF